MFKRRKVVMLPTNEKAHKGDLVINPNNKQLFQFAHQNCTEVAQHLYILSDEEIKKDDWVYQTVTKEIIKSPFNCINDDRYLKVIASTDPSLIKTVNDFDFLSNQSGTRDIVLPSPSQSFIEEYVSEYNKGNKIEKVMVEYENTFIIDSIYKESKEQLKPKINPKDNTITIKKIKDSWTRDEVTNLCENAYDSGKYSIIHKDIEQTFDKWIETNL